MVSKNRIKVMLIYIFLAIYISIGTVNVYAASGNSPVNMDDDGTLIDIIGSEGDHSGETIGDSSSSTTNSSNAGNSTYNAGTSTTVKDNSLWVDVGKDEKEYKAQQLGNCDGQDYAVGNVTIPSLEINPIVVSNTTSWGEDDFETWLRE